jgi:sulfotransferase
MKKFVFMAGTPRSGSTLLSAILNQNPRIHSEGMSGVCQMMWDLHTSINERCYEHLNGSNRQVTGYEIVRSIPHMYYANVDKPVIVDKCRTWTFPLNVEMLETYVTSKPKILVMTRPFDEIVDSFRSLYERNNHVFPEEKFLEPRTAPLTHSFEAIEYAKESRKDCYMFLDYHELVENTVGSLRRVYDFFEEEFFEHDLNNIVNVFPEDDSFYGLSGMHEVRSTVGYRNEE